MVESAISMIAVIVRVAIMVLVVSWALAEVRQLQEDLKFMGAEPDAALKNMKHAVWWVRFVLTLIVTVVALALMVSTFFPSQAQSIAAILPQVE